MTVNESGSTSSYVHQIFGDALAAGGAISAGSMCFTDTISDSDDLSKTESGTDTIADELSDGPSQTGSYTIDTTTGDHDTDAVTGTETLGAGGSISGGSDTVSWDDGDSISRGLEINGIDDATLNVTDSSTDTDGFGESGTETITTGGGDAPCTLNFDWNQTGTDDYQLGQANSGSTSAEYGWTWDSYSLDLTDTVSSSWHDTGNDELDDDGSTTQQSDTYSWMDLNSLTDSVTDIESLSIDLENGECIDETVADTGGGLDSFSLADSGTEAIAPTAPTPRA